MNRPRLVGVLSTVLGSTAGFLILTRWSLAGTVTGAILMPVIFTFVSFCSHEGMERAGKWVGCRVKKDSGVAPADTPETEETVVAGQAGPFRRSLQWSVVTLAFLAFGVSLYSLTQEPATEVTILHDKVVETVTVTVDKPTYSVAKSGSVEPTTVTTSSLAAVASQTTTTTAPVQDDQGDATATTVSTVPESATTTTVP